MTNTINITPNWESVAPIIAMVLQNPNAPADSIQTAQSELEKMAKLADLYVEQEKAKMCNCDDAQETHEHCINCDCVLTSHESETLCRSCE